MTFGNSYTTRNGTWATKYAIRLKNSDVVVTHEIFDREIDAQLYIEHKSAYSRDPRDYILIPVLTFEEGYEV